MLWLLRLRFLLRVGQSGVCGCPEFRTTGDPDFRALRKAQLRRRTIVRDFHLRCRSCRPPCGGPPETNLRVMKSSPVTLKSRADHTDRIRSSQDCVVTSYIYDFVKFIPD